MKSSSSRPTAPHAARRVSSYTVPISVVRLRAKGVARSRHRARRLAILDSRDRLHTNFDALLFVCTRRSASNKCSFSFATLSHTHESSAARSRPMAPNAKCCLTGKRLRCTHLADTLAGWPAPGTLPRRAPCWFARITRNPATAYEWPPANTPAICLARYAPPYLPVSIGTLGLPDIHPP